MSINFVSKASIDAKKEERIEYLQKKLEKAKSEFEIAKQKRELAVERGETQWMLPDLAKRLEDGDGKKKKKTKRKKSKKKLKKHKHERGTSDDGNSSKDEWEEAAQSEDVTKSFKNPTERSEKIKRDDWMLSSSVFDLASTKSSQREQKTKKLKEEKRRIEEEKLEAVQNSRELNPYWKDGGRGLPDDRPSSTNSPSTQNYDVGDGGRSWIEKSYERSKQQAIDEGVPLEDVVKRRWGSMAKLNALLKASEKASRSVKSGWRKPGVIVQECSVSQPSKSPMQQPERTTLDPVPSDKESSESTTESDEEGSGNEMVVSLTEKEKNELGAKILRAELMGDEELASTLKIKLESGTKKVPNQITTSIARDATEDVILTRRDKHGNAYPLKLHGRTDALNDKKKRRKKKIISTHNSDGKRVKYFEDDDNADLKSMVEKERLTSADDQHALMHKMLSKHYGGTTSDDFTVDDMFVSATATKGNSEAEERRLKDKAVAEHRHIERQMENCRFCFDNPNISKHLIVAIGIKTYLALPISASLTEGHCLILPMHHVVARSFMDEDVLQEVKIFKKGLTRMFADNDEDVVFLETCKHLNQRRHCVIECVPMPKEIGEMAPVYFKKAITECETEWSQNKKLVTVTSAGGVSKAVPKGLAYFSVEFGLDGGFAHVIEDEQSFPYNFGQEIIGGMMDLEVRLWRKPPKESFQQHKRKVVNFSEMWKPYDWTQKLKS